ncbi:hypothetical protein AB4Z46_28925 [Variovorax sp. M-6]|uniref:hypothetical protein n=1 Tax=Variovorax sp. M-6 TaxID=3233041 RepID=UPI003F981167
MTALRTPELAGYRYWGDSYNGVIFEMIFIKGRGTAYTFELGNDDAFERGRGFLLESMFLYQPSLYSRATADAAVTYDVVPISLGAPSAPTPVDALLAQLNVNGPDGYCVFGGGGVALPDTPLLRRNEASHAVCNFEYVPYTAPTADGQLAILNAQGARGYIPVLSSYGHMFWRKDMTQQATFEYYVVDRPASNLDWLDQLNREGATGALRYSGVSIPGKSVYRRIKDCTRPWLCGP